MFKSYFNESAGLKLFDFSLLSQTEMPWILNERVLVL